MVDILLRVIIGVVAGAAAVGTAAVIYEIITKSNIAEKIKEGFKKKRAEKDTNENKMENAFSAIVKEVQKDSVNVDVFFGTAEETEVEEITIYADEISDDIDSGNWISLVD